MLREKQSSAANPVDRTMTDRIRLDRRQLLKGSSALIAGGMLTPIGGAREAQAFAYEPYPRDDDLETVVTS